MKYILIFTLFLMLAIFIYIKFRQEKSVKMNNKYNINNSVENSYLSAEGSNQFNSLTKEEESVIKHGATEKPFTGSLLYNKDKGYYLCKQCNAPLFISDYKFDSRSGWPSFDESVENSIEYIKDKDGLRIEVRCKNCGGHLGHVFYGEGFTDKNTRYCINSLSLKFEGKSDLNASK